MVPNLDLGDLFCIYLNLWQILCKEEFFLCIFVMYIGFMYGFVIFMYYFL